MTQRDLLHKSKLLAIAGVMFCGACIIPSIPGKKIIEYFKEKPKTRLASERAYSPLVKARNIQNYSAND